MSSRTGKCVATVSIVSFLFILSALVSPGLAATIDETSTTDSDTKVEDSGWLMDTLMAAASAIGSLNPLTGPAPSLSGSTDEPTSAESTKEDSDGIIDDHGPM